MSHKEKVDFDQFASNYKRLLDDQLSFFADDHSYFSEYKVRLLRNLLSAESRSILDFGAGIGLTIPHLRKHFPQSEIFATDVSEESLKRLRQEHPDVHVLSYEDAALRKYDVILLITVLHHVARSLRSGLMQRLGDMLNPHGHLCIFEHNPYNLVTRWMVATCPFDADAVLLDKSESVRLLRDNAGLRIERAGYTLFFPPGLKRLRKMDAWLRWLPLGGQYYVIGAKA